MKRNTLLTIFILIIGTVVFGQNCPPGTIRLTSQSQVDSLIIDYPDCTEITGSLIISPATDTIFNLDSLSQLTYVSGSLVIENNPALASLNGLQNIDSVGGGLIIRNLNELQNLQGLNNITQIGRDLTIENSRRLRSLSGLDSLVNVRQWCLISGLDSLNDLSGLGKLRNTGAVLGITNNGQLESLNGLDNIQSLGSLTLALNSQLKDISVLSPITSLFGSLTLNQCPNLKDFSGLQNLEKLGALSIQNMGPMDMSAFASLDSILRDFGVSFQDSSIDFSGLENLAYIGYGFQVNQSPGISSFEGLDKLNTIGGVLWVYRCDSLVDFTGLESLNTTGRLAILGNEQLKNLAGLENLEQIGGDLSISENPELISITALNKLTSMGGDLQVSYNEKLPSLEGLGNIDYKTIGSIQVNDCANLSMCNTKSICDHIEFDRANTVIMANMTGCGNIEQVEDKCGTYVSIDLKEELESHLNIAPNPARNVCVISWENKFPTSTTLRIQDAMGKEILESVFQDEFIFDTSSLPAGLYHCTFIIDDQRIAKTIVKQ
ncbi:MAG: T9SS type A sorting domain-containing protein [Bacteroidia bacterium]